MKAYPDTSFLCAFYRKQHNTETAIEARSALAEPLSVTRLLLWEFRQGARFQAFRFRQDRSKGFALTEATRMIADLEEDLRNESVTMVDCDMQAVLIRAEIISRTRTSSGGHRSFDLLHVATAIELGAVEFWSFDGNQNGLARAEGLVTPLA